MSDNDQYPKEKHGTFTPVGVVLVIAICALVGVFLYHRIEGRPGLGAPTSAPASAPGAPAAPAGNAPNPNPNQLAPVPAPGQNPTTP